MHGLAAQPVQVTSLRRPPAWCADYVGIPFLEHGRDRNGCDCWGLVRLVLAERFGIFMPSYADAYRSTKDARTIAATLAEQRSAWRRVSGPHFREGDVALLEIDGLAMHVGLIVGWPWILHVQGGIDSACDRLDRPHWANGWAQGRHSAWRHPGLVG